MKVLLADVLIKRVDDLDIDEQEAEDFSRDLMQFLEDGGYEMGGVIALVEEDLENLTEEEDEGDDDKGNLQ
jgi:hypothetical protein